jgi:hypothetical protein
VPHTKKIRSDLTKEELEKEVQKMNEENLKKNSVQIEN